MDIQIQTRCCWPFANNSNKIYTFEPTGRRWGKGRGHWPLDCKRKSFFNFILSQNAKAHTGNV